MSPSWPWLNRELATVRKDGAGRRPNPPFQQETTIDDCTRENDTAMVIAVLEEIAPEDGPRAVRRGEMHAS